MESLNDYQKQQFSSLAASQSNGNISDGQLTRAQSIYIVGGSSQYQNSKDNVKVVIRVRPLNEREKSNGGHKKCVNVENDCSISLDGYKPFNFDYVADEEVPQDVIFEQIAQPIANCCLEGYNGSIFAYGQTGSGKTFTIQGPTNIINGEEIIFGSRKKSIAKVEENQRGLMQRSFEYIFECLESERVKAEASGDSYQFEFLIRCSYLEIYNEQIMDLLEPSSVNLHIREDIKKGVYVEGLQEEVILSAEDMISLIQQGSKNRHVGSHAMNKESSRSHSVLTTIIETKSMKEGGGVWNIKTSRFHIIDLAGSERSKQTNAVGERLKEAGMINKSLSALGNVINSLVDISEGKSRHVHYRDSKLTFLLRDSLGGNSKTLIIANVSPSNSCHGETLSTLKFAQRAKLIKNKAVINEDSSGTISLLKSEIARLKKDLAENEKMMRALQSGTNLSECQRCKAMIDGIENEDGLREDDEMLVSFDNEDQTHQTSVASEKSLQLKKKISYHLKQENVTLRGRVTHLESLLSANLELLSNQQKLYESEVQKLQLQAKRMQQTVESYEKQSARDKMIIKFREERISKLEQVGTTMTSEEENLKKEVQLWKEAADRNTAAAKLFAEKSDLQNKLDTLQREVKHTPESLSCQNKTLTELNESLNQYLKTYCEESKIELERELQVTKLESSRQIADLLERIKDQTHQESEKIRRFQEKEESYKQSINDLKQDIMRIETQFSEERQELVRLNQDMISKLTDESKNTKDEQERQLKLFQVKLSELEQHIELEKESKHEIERKANLTKTSLSNEIKDLKGQLHESQTEITILLDKDQANKLQIDKERKSHEDVLKVVEARWEQSNKELEEQLVDCQNQKDEMSEQLDQIMDQLSSLRSENESQCKQLLEKDELVNDLSTTLDERTIQIRQVQSQNEQYSVQLSQLKQKLKLSDIQHEQQIQEFQSQLGQSTNYLEQLKSDHLQEKIDLNEKHQIQLTQLQNQNSASITDLNEIILQKQNEQDILLDEFSIQLQNERNLHNAKLNEVIKELDEIKQAKSQLEIQLKKQIEDLSKEVQERDQQIKIFENSQNQTQSFNSEQLSRQKQQISQFIKDIEQKQEEIYQLQEELREHTNIINDFKSNNESLQRQNNDLKLKLEESQQLLRQGQDKQKDKDSEIQSLKDDKMRLINNFEQQIDRLTSQRILEEEDIMSSIDEERKQFQLQIQQTSRDYEEKLLAKEALIQRQTANHNCEKRDLNDQIQELNKTIAQQKQALDQSQTKYQDLLTQYTHKNEELKRLNEHLQKLNTAFSDSSTKLQTYHMETSRLANQLEQSLAQNDLLLQDLEQKQQAIEDYLQRIDQYEQLLSQKDIENQDLQQSIADKQSEHQLEIDSLIQNIQEKDNQMRKSFNLNLQEKQKQIDELNSQLDTLKTRNDLNHQQEIEQLNKQIKILQNQLKEKITENELEVKLKQAYQENEIQKQESQKIFDELLDSKEQEIKAKDQENKDLVIQLGKIKKRNQEQEEMLNSCKDTITMMRKKEAELENEIKLKYQQIIEKEERLKKQIQDSRNDNDRLRNESDHLKELIRIKDRQMEDWLNAEERDKQALERISKENKSIRAQMTKTEFEMKELAKTLKMYLEENIRLKKDNEILHKENDQLIGHKNPSQKIQHHVRIKEENNRLREENIKLQEELRKRLDNGDSSRGAENTQATVLKFIDSLISQPFISQFSKGAIQEDDSLNQKVNKAIELISHIGDLFQSRDQRVRDLEKEVVKLESFLNIQEHDRKTVIQQHRDMVFTPPPLMIGQNSQSSIQLSIPQSVKNISQSQALLNKENFSMQQHKPIRSIPIEKATFPAPQKKEQGSQPKQQLIGHPVRGGSAKRLVSGAAAAFINAGQQQK